MAQSSFAQHSVSHFGSAGVGGVLGSLVGPGVLDVTLGSVVGMGGSEVGSGSGVGSVGSDVGTTVLSEGSTSFGAVWVIAGVSGGASVGFEPNVDSLESSSSGFAVPVLVSVSVSSDGSPPVSASVSSSLLGSFESPSELDVPVGSSSPWLAVGAGVDADGDTSPASAVATFGSSSPFWNDERSPLQPSEPRINESASVEATETCFMRGQFKGSRCA